MTPGSPASPARKRHPAAGRPVAVLAQNVVEALHGVWIAFQLADDRAGVNVIHAREAHPLTDDAEGDAVILLSRVR